MATTSQMMGVFVVHARVMMVVTFRGLQESWEVIHDIATLFEACLFKMSWVAVLSGVQAQLLFGGSYLLLLLLHLFSALALVLQQWIRK